MKQAFTSQPGNAAAQVHKTHPALSNQRFEPLPAATGSPPYRLELADVLGQPAVDAIKQHGSLSFHVAGDTGGVKFPVAQQIVAMKMAADLENLDPRPSFYYHLGDVVYYNGEEAQYYPQFYEPYSDYDAPILAIPGNHDGDPLDAAAAPPLAAFVENFCADKPHLTRASQESHRAAMTLPNVYWTFLAPFATIVGLYTNVPEGGRVDDQQIAWLVSELEAAPKDAALIVALHHPPYSADAHHGGSARMGTILDSAFDQASRIPDLVMTGHVHNYQRFTRKFHRRELPYIVAGAGGYWHLHYMAKDANGKDLATPWPVPDSDVTLESFCDDRHGFLRLHVTGSELRGEYVSVPRPQESWRNGPVTVVDSFSVKLKR